MVRQGGLSDTLHHTHPREPQTYHMSFPWEAYNMECPVEGCPGRASSWIILRVHFVHRHMQDKKVVLEEGNFPLPCYPQCDMFVSWESLNERHLAREVKDILIGIIGGSRLIVQRPFIISSLGRTPPPEVRIWAPSAVIAPSFAS